MNPNQRSFREKLMDIGGAIGALVTLVIMAADQRVRPLLVEAWRFMRTNGLRGLRLARQIYDRQLVVMLRPVLVVSASVQAVCYSLGGYGLYKMGLIGHIGEAGWWLFVIALAMLAGNAIAFARIWSVRMMTDHDIRTIRGGIVTVNQTPQQIQEALGKKVLAKHGAPGRAPSTLAAILFSWLVAGLWFIATGIVLRSWFGWALPDERVTSVFVGVGSVLLCVFAVLWVAAAVMSAVSMRYGIGFVVWGARLILRPAAQALPGVDDRNLDDIIPDDLNVPYESTAATISSAHELPFGIAAGLLALLLTEHSLGYLMFLAGDTLVLLFGWYFIVKTTGITSRRIFNAIIIGHFVLAVVQLLLRLAGSSICDLSWGAGCFIAGIPRASLVLVGLVAVVLGWLASRNHSRKILVAAMVIGLPVAGIVTVRALSPVGYLCEASATAAVPVADPSATTTPAASAPVEPSPAPSALGQTVPAGTHPPAHVCSFAGNPNQHDCPGVPN